jgi:hypothetical protein
VEKTRTEAPKQDPNPVSTAETTPGTQPATEPTTPSQPEPLSEEALRARGARLRSNIKITGRVLDAAGNGISNAVVILVSPSGSVIASTTNNEGNYSFTVTPTQKTYRVIPSKDGFTFSPVDKAFAGLRDDQRGIDFVATKSP